jgi:hypothetical protein
MKITSGKFVIGVLSGALIAEAFHVAAGEPHTPESNEMPTEHLALLAAMPTNGSNVAIVTTTSHSGRSFVIERV